MYEKLKRALVLEPCVFTFNVHETAGFEITDPGQKHAFDRESIGSERLIVPSPSESIHGLPRD